MSDLIKTINIKKETCRITSDSLITKIEEASKGRFFYALLYKDYEVQLGTYNNGSLKTYNNTDFEISYLNEVRLFNAKEEIRAVKYGNDYIFRHVEDETGDIERDIYDELPVVLGSSVSYKNLPDGWCMLKEGKGSRLITPFVLEEKDYKTGDTTTPILYYKTRNYIEYNENNELIFTDARLCGFISADGKTEPEVTSNAV